MAAKRHAYLDCKTLLAAEPAGRHGTGWSEVPGAQIHSLSSEDVQLRVDVEVLSDDLVHIASLGHCQ